MTLHFHKPNYECPNCGAIFLPYKRDTKCPKCEVAISDNDTEKYLNSIEDIAGSMRIHKRLYGKFTPGAWLTSNIMDHVQGIIFQIFDAMEEKKPKNQEQYLADLLDQIGWGDQEYSKAHIKNIAIEILKIYNTEKFYEIEYDKPLSPTKGEKIKMWFSKFLP